MGGLLITGASGMVGRNLIDTNPGYEILTPSHNELDLLDYGRVIRYLHIHRPTAIIHAAGIVGGIQANVKDNTGFFLSNLQMGLNLVSAAYKSGVKNILNLGSSCIYPVGCAGPLTEKMLFRGEPEKSNEGYAYAKMMILKLCQYYNKQDGTNYKTIIPCNLYGRYDNFDPQNSHLIAGAIAKLHNGNGKIWGDGIARREFMYAGDLAEIIWKHIERFGYMPEVLNIGTGKDYTINQYYRAIAGVVGYDGEFVHDMKKPVGVGRKLLDVTMQRKLKLIPTTTLKKGLELTYEYYINSLHLGQRGNTGD